MADKTIDFQGTIQFRRGTQDDWATINPVLAAGELGIELDTGMFKIGDGILNWNGLPYGGLQGPRGLQGPEGPKGDLGDVTPAAEAAAEAAQAAAETATTKAAEAVAAANTATTISTEIGAIVDAVNQAVVDARSASDDAVSASTSASNDADAAHTSAQNAAASATAAANSASSIGTAVSDASASALAAAQSANLASSKADESSSSATLASTKAGEAANSAAAASTSAGNASASATTASNAATTATTKAGEAADSATAAAASATAAAAASGGSQPPIARNTYDVISGSGLLNNSTTASGGTWYVTGSGFDDAIRNPEGYATSTENAYCHLQASASIRRAVQVFSGNQCTLAIGHNINLTDMIHVNFSSNSYADVLYWRTGVGSSMAPTHVTDCNLTGVINDGQPHEFVIELVDKYCFCFCDGVLISVAYDPIFPQLKGRYTFAQLHGGDDAATDRLYALSTFTDIQQKEITKTVANLMAETFRNNAPVSGPSLRIGDMSSGALYDLDLAVETGIIRNPTESLKLKLWSSEGFPTELHFGNDPDALGDGDVILRRDNEIYGLKLLIGGSTAAQFPYTGLSSNSAYFPNIGIGDSNDSTAPGIYSAEDIPEFTAVPGSLALSKNGNVYRRTATNQWVAV